MVSVEFSSDLLNALPAEAAVALMRAHKGLCAGCGKPEAATICWKYTVRVSGKRELAYDTMPICSRCYSTLRAAGWCNEHEVTWERYRAWRTAHREDWDYELAKENVHVAEI